MSYPLLNNSNNSYPSNGNINIFNDEEDDDGVKDLENIRLPTSRGTSNERSLASRSDVPSNSLGAVSNSPDAPLSNSKLTPVNLQCARESCGQTNRRGDEIPFNSPSPLQLSHQINSLSTSIATSNSINYSTQSGQVLFNWQASKSTVKERLSALYNRETLADVHFIVGSQAVRIPSHKFILSIGSAVFDAMFNGKMAIDDDNDIVLPDIEPAAFNSLLRFLYTDEVHIGPETVMTTLYTAKKYAVPAMEKQCVEFLKQNLGSDNAFMLLTQARLFDETVLAQMCLDTIDKHTDDALSAEGFLEIDFETLCIVLKRDNLRIREVLLFKAVVRWAEAECGRRNLPITPDNQRSVLGRALYLIRFPLMTIEEFASDVAQCGILTDREVVNLFLYFVVNPKPQIQFPDVPRCCITGKEQIVCRFARTESRWGYSGTSDRIRFIVDRRIFVIGFGLYGSIHGPSDYDCNIQIIHTGSGKVLASNDTAFSCDGTPSTFRVCFKNPVEIMPNTNYTACATLKGSDSHYGTNGTRKVTVDLQGGGKVTFQFSYAAGCNNGTSIEDGQVPEIIFFT